MNDNNNWFHILLEEGSITQAAARLNVTQQTLSARLSSLEENLGARLINRTLPLTTTRQGEAYLEYEEQLASLNRSFQRKLDESAQGSGGTLRVGIGVTRGKVLIPSAMEQFSMRHPSTRIELTEESNERIIQLLLDKQLDVGVARFTETIPGLDLTPLHKEEMAFAIPPNHASALTAQDVAAIKKCDLSALANCPFLMCAKGDIAQRIGQAVLNCQKFEPFTTLTSGCVDLLLNSCRKGIGAVFCPDFLLPSSLSNDGVLVVPLGEHTRYIVSAGTIKNSEIWSAKTDFIDCLKNTAKLLRA